MIHGGGRLRAPSAARSRDSVAAVKALRIALLMALLGACGNDQDPVVAPGGTTSTSEGAGTTGGPITTTVTPGAGGGGFATTTVSTTAGERGLLAEVEATHAGAVDRVTFTFEDAVPPYRVGYVDRPLIQDGSGDEVTVDGAAVLGVHFEPASGFDLSGEGRQVYRGPDRLDLATTVVLDVVRVGDFEANLDWAIGVDGATVPFRVRTEGRSVVVEVQVPPGG